MNRTTTKQKTEIKSKKEGKKNETEEETALDENLYAACDNNVKHR